MPNTHFTIKHHSPRRKWFAIISTVIILALSFFLVYQYGAWKGAQVKQAYLAKERTLLNQVAALKEENQQLINTNAMLERSEKIDRQTLKESQDSLRVVKAQFDELKKELSFYKSLVTPSDILHGIQIKSFTVRKSDLTGGYAARLVLMQSKNNRYASGRVSLVIDGLSGGKVKSLDLVQLGGAAKTIPFRFKYFETLNMTIVLPEDFIPSSVIIKVSPRGKRIKPVEKIYNWAELTS